jgi:hypothetical protein
VIAIMAMERPRSRGKDEPRDIHMRCVSWGHWARCAMPGAEGTSEGYLRQRLDAAHPGEPSAEVAETDKAVARMRVARPDYWRFFARYYLNPTELSEYEIALELGYSLERVEATLRQARILVGYHLNRAAENA